MEPKKIKQTVRASDQTVNYAWCNYSFYGNAIPIKRHSLRAGARRTAYPLAAMPASIPLKAVLVTCREGSFLSDGGSTFAALKRKYGMTEQLFREHLQRLYGANRMCLLDEVEVAVPLQKEVTPKKAEEILCGFVGRIATVCSVIEKK